MAVSKKLRQPGKEPDFESTHIRSSRRMDNLPENLDLSAGACASEYGFREYLAPFDLTPAAVDIMVLRYVYDMSFQRIVEDLGTMSFGTVWNLHKEVVKSLKKRLK